MGDRRNFGRACLSDFFCGKFIIFEVRKEEVLIECGGDWMIVFMVIELLLRHYSIIINSICSRLLNSHSSRLSKTSKLITKTILPSKLASTLLRTQIWKNSKKSGD